MIRSVNIRALKDGLSGFLRDVQRGDIILVTDRGRVVAELRSPTVGVPITNEVEARRQQLIDRGVLRPGLPNSKDAYVPAHVHLSSEVIQAALDADREDR